MTQQDLSRVECACAKCVNACKDIPGWFLPNEVAEAAAIFKMTEQQFFEKYLTVDYWTGDTIFVLRPRTVAEPGGEVSPAYPFGHRCVFLDENNRCSIHAAKPHECAITYHEIKRNGRPKFIADAWRAHQQHIEDLQGSPLEEPRFDIFDALRLFSR